MSFYGTAGLLAKDVQVRLPSGEIVTMPLAWIRGEFGKGAYTFKRVRAKLKADQLNTENTNGPHLTS